MDFKHYTSNDIVNMEDLFRRNFVNCLSGFKSVNLVGTINQKKETNLAIFSQVFHLGANPALMGLIFRPDTVTRHTLDNILETGYYTFNHITEDFYQKAHQTSARYQVSEFEALDLKPEYLSLHPAPYLADASIKIGLKFEERIDLKINGTVFIIGSVVETIIPEACIGVDGFIDLEKAATITCSGLDSYHQTKKIMRLSYAKPDKPLHGI